MNSSLFQVPGFREFEFEFEGASVHAWEGGVGQPLILAHGSGAGCQTLSNWRNVLEPLSHRYHVLAADFVGFGLSDFRPKPPYFDMAMWQRQLEAMIDRFPDNRKVGLIGHSFAGPIVLRTAVSNPRVAGIVVTGTAGRTHLPNSGGPGWRYPDDEVALRRGVGRTVFDQSLVDDAEIERRMLILGKPGARQYFNSMFEAPKQALVEAMSMADTDLQAINCPVIFIHGQQDASFAPEDTSLPMAKQIPGADVLILNRCAHSVALEHPSKFLAAVAMTFGGAF